jgi:ApbE superfamily uncharacterized protein (UPF0280 family)
MEIMPINDRREYLLDRLRAKEITPTEAVELRQILEKEKKTAINLGDIALVFAVTIMLGLLADHLSKSKFSFGFGANKRKKA